MQLAIPTFAHAYGDTVSRNWPTYPTLSDTDLVPKKLEGSYIKRFSVAVEEHIYQEDRLASAFPLAPHGRDQLTSSDHGQGERRKSSWIVKAHGCDGTKSRDKNQTETDSQAAGNKGGWEPGGSKQQLELDLDVWTWWSVEVAGAGGRHGQASAAAARVPDLPFWPRRSPTSAR